MISTESLRPRDHGNGVFAIQVTGSESGNSLSPALIKRLLETLEEVRRAPSVKVLILEGTREFFLRGDRAGHNEAIAQALYSVIASFPYPVIAALRGDARGAGFLVGALCDFMVCSQTAAYSFADPETRLFPGADVHRLFDKRFGHVRATDFLYSPTKVTGQELQDKGWSCPILPPEQVEAYALRLATNLAEKSQDSLRLLKQHLAAPILELARALAAQGDSPENLPEANTRIAPPGKRIQLEARANHVLVLRIRDIGKTYETKALIADLAACFTQLAERAANRTTAYRAVVWVSEYSSFLPEPEDGLPADAILSIQRVLLKAALPVIAVLSANASGGAWLVSQFCDATVYRSDGTYCAASLLRSPELARLAAEIFSQRFGADSGREFLLTGATYSGTDLRLRVGAVPVAAHDQVLTEAVRRAEFWGQWPLEAVVSWKKHMTFAFQEAIERLSTEREPEAGSTHAATGSEIFAAPTPIALQSAVIEATAHPDGVVVVTMADRDAKNMFSDEFIEGMHEVFAHIEVTPRYKVVVLTGYDKYFASGGTREALLAIQEGKLKFTDDKTYQLAWACRIPVIAVMQGHAIGAGLSLGLFADLTLLSEESKYVSPYMGYGFTPGVAATLIVPEKLGQDLSRDTLLTAQEYAGSELKSRCVGLRVHSRKQVLEIAMGLAKQIARQDRDTLVSIKHRLNGSLRDKLPVYCERELAMHELTFVGRADTLQRIQDTFDPTGRAANAGQVESVAAATGAGDEDALREVLASIKALLAKELHLEAQELDEHSQFIDLGLDSITGVTWIRKVNEKYGLSLVATIVYSYPTLAKLGRHIQENTGKVGVVADGPPAPARAVSVAASTVAHVERAGAMPHTGGEVDREVAALSPGAQAARDVAALPTGAQVEREIAALSAGAQAARDIAALPTGAQFEREGATAPGASSIERGAVPPSSATHLERTGVCRGTDSQTGFRELVSWRQHRPARIEIEPAAVRKSQAIAVIGMAGQFPEARTLKEFWARIAAGKHCISPIPQSRWDVEACFQAGEPAEGKTNCRYMGLLEEYDRFDPLFFNISPAEAQAMDPQQRLFLQTCWHSIEHAGYNPKSLAGSRCGVFAGCGSGEYGLLSRKIQLSAHGFTGGANSILAARIAYFLDLQGPCLSIDTACSSSLVAVASACDSLLSGVSDLALAGGVYVNAGPAMHIMTSQAGMLSTNGTCYAFDQRANGFVPGEAVGVVLLKRLEDAQRDRDIIHAVIQGWGVNQDGRTNGITAPNPQSQARLEQFVYSRHEIDPADIQLIEAHGTGTALGDPIEIEGLKQSFQACAGKPGSCALGSVKANIGHCLAAAGVAGLIKLILALEHKQLPPAANFERLNEHIDLRGTPFYVNTRLQDWALNGASKRQAAVSSFGYSGTNAHVVVAESVSAAGTKPAPGAAKVIVPLSAKTPEQLRQKAQDLADFIREEGGSVALAELAYTLQVGREPMDERLAFWVDSREQLAEKLQAYLAGRQNIAEVYHGQVRLNKEGTSLLTEDEELKNSVIDRWIAQRRLAKLVRLWVKGVDFDWNKLYGEDKPQRRVVPVYPFAKERYWIEHSATRRFDAETSTPHRLLHRNTSTLSQQSYTSVLRGPLSQDTFLEMARAAVALAAAPPCADSADVQLKKVEWGDPFAAAEERQVTVELFALEGTDIGFEIRGEDRVYCQGEAALTPQRAAQASQELFFEEYWTEQPPAPLQTDTTGDCKTILFADDTLRHELANAVVVTQPADCLEVLERAGKQFKQPLSVIYTWAQGRRAAGIDSLFDLFKAVQASGSLVSDVTLVGQYAPASVETCWDYSWIGFERSLKLLRPDVRVSVLLTESGACTAAQLADARRSGGVTWYRGDRRFVLAFKPSDAHRATQAPTIKQNGAYLITGGCGALGLMFARHLAEHYQAKLVLLGRRALTGAIQEQLTALRQAGAQEAHYAAVDVGDAEALRAWAESLPFPLSGIFHAAGVDPARAFHEQSAADIDAVLRPKTAGTVLLDEVLHDQPLDFVCYFSSSAAVLGDFGACDYSIANRFLMAYAHYRQHHARLPGKTVVINWPFWEKAADGTGMGAKDAGQAAFYLKSSGQEALGGARGIQIWHDLMQAEAVQTLVLFGKAARIEQFLRRIYCTERSSPAAAAPSAPPVLPAQTSPPRNVAGPTLKERVRAELRQLVCGALNIDPRRLDDAAHLADYGFDSISLAAFAKRLTSHFSLDVTPALFFSHSTIRQLVDHFAGEHANHLQGLYGASEAPAAAQVHVLATPGETRIKTPSRPRRRFLSGAATAVAEPIAIIGMSGRFPQASNVDQLWSLLAQAKSGITEIPAARWNWREHETRTNQGGFIEGVAEFDPLFFEISPREAEEMDPAERLLLMEAYRAIEDARLSPASLRGSNVGVFVGMEEGQYSLIAEQGVTTGGNAMISSRLSYFLDLHGPAIATNTACSSGLVALHQAAMSLRQGECTAALVASVALSLAPQAWVKMSEAGMLSPDGRCFSFAKQANGIGIGEAVVVLMLKPLGAALANGDHLYGLIKASGINFDGKTNGVTAPNGRMQAQLIEDLYRRHGIDIDDVSHIVAHGTGTRLGDPVELNALNEAFSKLSKSRSAASEPWAHCAVTSCKSNVGHTMAASGLVSLVGLLKGLQHQQIPASLYCEEENDYITARDSYFYINKTTRSWARRGDRPLMGAVSAFGRSGTNAHVVIEEFRGAPAAEQHQALRPFATKVLVPLSARTTGQLEQKARDLLDHLAKPAELQALAYTLQTSREPLSERIAFVVSSIEELADRLRAYLRGERDNEAVARGTVGASGDGIGLIGADDDMQEAIGKWIAHQKLAKLAQLWVTGVELDWERFYDPTQPKPARIGLPTYPFARERYWIDNSASTPRFLERPARASRLEKAHRLESIEEIIDQVDDGSIATSQAVAFLKAVV